MIAVIDPRMPSSAKARLKEICEVIELPPFSALDARVASHPDMLIFPFEGKLFVCKNYYKEAKEAIDKIITGSELKLVLTDDILGSKYPNDVKFNAFVLSEYLVGKRDSISAAIKNQAENSGFQIADTSQGYAKCSTVVLDNAIITADKGIYNLTCGLGYDTLLVNPCDVALRGYSCGFIGGASGVFGKKIYFCGDITKHQNGTDIIDFCNKKGYEVISLSSEPLYDVGTIIFI